MTIRCRKCVFKDVDGGKHPCNDCSEIMDMKGAKCTENHFKQLVEYNKNIRPKERLEQKLNEIVVYIGKKIIYEEYKELEDGNMMLTVFLKSGKNIAVYQIVDTGEELVQNVVFVDRKFINIK